MPNQIIKLIGKNFNELAKIQSEIGKNKMGNQGNKVGKKLPHGGMNWVARVGRVKCIQ
jgi:hypothetical protein